jgi:hypothetical protein
MSNRTRHTLFGPVPSKAETKADITNHAARTIIGDEAARREAKTERLRQARLENEARLSAAPASTKPRDLDGTMAPRSSK